MQTQLIPTGAFARWMTFEQAVTYCGLSLRTLQNYEKAGNITVANVIQPGSTRGRKLVDRLSLDSFIEASIGNVTTADICGRKGGAA